MDEPVMEGYGFLRVEYVSDLHNMGVSQTLHKLFVGYWFNGVSDRIWGVQVVWECMALGAEGLINESADRSMIEDFSWQPRRATHVVLIKDD